MKTNMKKRIKVCAIVLLCVCIFHCLGSIVYNDYKEARYAIPDIKDFKNNIDHFENLMQGFYYKYKAEAKKDDNISYARFDFHVSYSDVKHYDGAENVIKEYTYDTLPIVKNSYERVSESLLIYDTIEWMSFYVYDDRVTLYTGYYAIIWSPDGKKPEYYFKHNDDTEFAYFKKLWYSNKWYFATAI